MRLPRLTDSLQPWCVHSLNLQTVPSQVRKSRKAQPHSTSAAFSSKADTNTWPSFQNSWAASSFVTCKHISGNCRTQLWKPGLGVLKKRAKGSSENILNDQMRKSNRQNGSTKPEGASCNWRQDFVPSSQQLWDFSQPTKKRKEKFTDSQNVKKKKKRQARKKKAEIWIQTET